MGTERKSPDVLLLQTNLTGSVSDIQDDPDSPDSNWLTYITNNVDTVCHVSFPTPTGPPTEGADLQEFKIWVRQQPDGAGADPTVRIELYEDGGSLATILADTPVSSTSGALYSGTWNANLLANADGSLVECYIYGTAVGGAPDNRCTVEVGAVEWNVTYTGVVHLHGTSGGQAGASGQIEAKTSLQGASGGEAGASAQITASTHLAGASAGQAGAAAVLTAKMMLAGASAGQASAEGTLSARTSLLGASAGQATALGALAASTHLSGASAGAATADGLLAGYSHLTGASAGQAGADGAIRATTHLAGASAGEAFVTGVLTILGGVKCDIRGLIGLANVGIRQFHSAPMVARWILELSTPIDRSLGTMTSLDRTSRHDGAADRELETEAGMTREHEMNGDMT